MNKWDVRFLELAKHISEWSQDPSTKVGSVIVDADNRIISMGYNGFPKKVKDLPERLTSRETKLDLTVHAEINAILFSRGSLVGTTLYVWPLPPCVRCVTQIIQVGIKRVVCPNCLNNEKWADSCAKGRDILVEAGIDVEWIS